MKKLFYEMMKNIPELTQEEIRKKQEEWDHLPEEEKRRKTIIADLLTGYYDSLGNNDLFEAAKYAGKYELIDPENSPLYSGKVREIGKDYSGAIKDYEKIGPGSEIYVLARNSLENLFAIIGDYRRLVDFYNIDGHRYSDIHKLKNRINCLMHMSDEQIENEKDYINNVPMETVIKMDSHNEDDVHCFFHLCHMFAIMIEFAGEMISECYHMQISKDWTIQDYENDPDLKQPIAYYNRYVYMTG